MVSASNVAWSTDLTDKAFMVNKQATLMLLTLVLLLHKFRLDFDKVTERVTVRQAKHGTPVMGPGSTV